MSDPMRPHQPRRSSGSERIFEDDVQRLWSAGPTTTPRGSDAVIFTCISDAREPPRAVVLTGGRRLLELATEELRRLLLRAPRVGRL